MTVDQKAPAVFKSCTMCSAFWPDRDAFLTDPELALIGYQANFTLLVAGYLLFNHSCGTTIAIPVKDLRDLYSGVVAATRVDGTAACPGYCLRENSLDSCSEACECAFVREILQRAKAWPKAPELRTDD